MKPLKLKMRAFGSYAEETEIDFTKPTQNLFLVTGDTGSGKTTVFDALVFALYGQASSVTNKKEGLMLQSQFASLDTEPFVELTFAESAAMDAPVYVVRRIPKHKRPMKRKSSKGNLEAIAEGRVELYLPDGTSCPERDKEINAKLEQLVGLTREQFMQTSMIAQGEFMEVLRAKTNVKKEIFRKIFHTQIYDRIDQILEERKGEKDAVLRDLRAGVKTEVEHIDLVETESEQYEQLLKLQHEIRSGSDGILEEFLDALKSYDEILLAKCSEQEQSSAKAREEAEVAQRNHTKAEELLRNYKKLEEAQSELEECGRLEAQMEELKEQANALRAAMEIKPLWENYVHAKERLEELTKQIAAQEAELPNYKKQSEEAGRKLSELEPVVEVAVKELALIKEKTEKANKYFEELENRTGKIQESERELTDAKARQKATEEQIAVLNKEIEKLADTMKRLEGEPARFEKLVAQAERIRGFETQYKALLEAKKQTERCEEQLQKRQEEFKKARDEYQLQNNIFESLQNIYLEEQAGILANKLEEGKPCIVCGSTAHPSPYRIRTEVPIPTREELDEAAQKKNAADAARNKKALQAEGAKSDRDNSRKNENDLQDALAQSLMCDSAEDFETYIETLRSANEKEMTDCQAACKMRDKSREEKEEKEKELQKLSEELKKISECITTQKTAIETDKAILETLQNATEYQTLQEAKKALAEAEDKERKAQGDKSTSKRAYEQANEKLQQLKAALETNQNHLPQNKAECENRKKSYEELLLTKKYTSGEDWMGLTEIYGKETLKDWEEEIQKFRERKIKAEEAIKVSKELVGEKEKPNLELLREKCSETNERYKEIHSRWMALDQARKDNEKVRKSLGEKYEQQKEEFNQCKRLSKLRDRIGGHTTSQNKMDLETYVQRYYLEKILYAANRRFERMSAGQFQILLKKPEEAGNARNEGLDLMVYSLVTGSRREISTLSGGESFMAALSLALGMADQIRESSSAINLDIMFIDEGFGSLDDHSRSQAVRILQEMAGNDKLIGIISHVSELKQEIDNQLIVSKNDKGSHAKWRIS